MDGPDRPHWRREDMNKTLEQTNEDQDAKAKKPRKFSQEKRRGPHTDNTSVAHQKSDKTKAQNQSSESRERTQRGRENLDFQHDDHQRKHAEVKRRQGPIKPPKPQSQDEQGASGQDDLDHVRASQDPSCKDGRGSGRRTPLEARGGRQSHLQHQRPGQRKWDKVPESKETQTG